MIRLVKSTFLEEEKTKTLLADFIKNAKQLSFGPECDKFEKGLAAWQGREQAVFVNSGSSANLAIVQALLNLGKLKKGDIVGFSALTWYTNVMPLFELGLVPVPIDVEMDTLSVSSKKLLERLEILPLKGLFITNLLGFCDDIDEIEKICRDKGIVLFEDNCESFGTVYKGRKLGNFGIASTFSFFVGHHLSTVEGGAICTDDLELARMLRIVRAHGWDRNLPKEEQDKIRSEYGVNGFYGKYAFYDVGYNLRPTEIAGFIGNTQLPYADMIVSKRVDNFKKIAAAIYAKKDRYYPIRFDHIDTISNFAVPLVCRTPEIRDALVTASADKVETRPLVGGNITRQPFFAKYSDNAVKGIQNPNADFVHDNGLYFANNPELTSEDLETILSVFS